jgi:Na+/melibiose symporter-like transporter
MTDRSSFQLSQGLEVLPPRSGQAYPIPCDEWAILKGKISKMTSEPWFFHTVGSLLLGAALSTLVTILFGSWRSPEQERTLVIAWAATATTTISGLLCLFFANKERAVKRERAQDLIAQMDLIEKRYDRSSP